MNTCGALSYYPTSLKGRGTKFASLLSETRMGANMAWVLPP